MPRKLTSVSFRPAWSRAHTPLHARCELTATLNDLILQILVAVLTHASAPGVHNPLVTCQHWCVASCFLVCSTHVRRFGESRSQLLRQHKALLASVLPTHVK